MSLVMVTDCGLRLPAAHSRFTCQLATEAEIELPCATESCSARWDFEAWIAIACMPRDDPARKGKEFVLMRGKDGKWNRFGR